MHQSIRPAAPPPTLSPTVPALTPIRETFSVSRHLEYFSEAELTKQIGHRRSLWMSAILKELLDNSADHAEEIGRLPSINIKLASGSISIQDNGDGIPPATVAGMIDFSTRTSSRVATRCPTRGAQGNAAKCFLGAPYVLNDGTAATIIMARGVRHDIRVGLDPLAQQPQIDHRQTPENVHFGTYLRMEFGNFPSNLDDHEVGQIVQLCRNFAVLNPHLSLKLKTSRRVRKWERTAEACSKWTAADADPAAWYDVEAFERLAAACIANDRKLGTDRRLSDFVRQFAGLKRSAALKAVAEESGLARASLSSLLNSHGLDRKKTTKLLCAMQKHGKAPKAEKLGCIGRQHIEHHFGPVQYRKIAGEHNGLPFVVEAAFAESGNTRDIITGVNFSPSISGPVVRMLDWLLAQQMIDEESRVKVLLHISVVAPVFLDRGKAVLEVEGALEDAVTACITAVTKSYRAQRKREERSAAAQERRLERLNRSRPEVSLKEAIILVLPDAIKSASFNGACDFSDRDLYYAARALIQSYTSENLSQKWFDKVVDEWEAVHGLIEGRLRDPRGFLLEPHTKKRIPLGTKAVDGYQIPAYLFDTILFVEKKGMLSKFEFGQIGEKYDCAIIAAEGYAPRAAKALIDAAQQGHKMKVLCFHDADPHGLNIARTLSESTGAHRYNIDIIDAGLHMEEAIAMGLPTETFTRKKSLPTELRLSEVDLKYFSGQPRRVIGKNGKPTTEWVNCRRVELNALSENPPAFVKWIESKLKLHGVAKKLIPPKRVIEKQVRVVREEILNGRIQQHLEDAINLDAMVAKIAKSLIRRVRVDDAPAAVGRWGKKATPSHWTTRVNELVDREVGKLDREIRSRVADAVSELGGRQ